MWKMVEVELARDVGLFGALAIGLGTMIGAGVFILPSIASAAAGPASIISFVAGGMVSLLAALSLSELCTSMPVTGGSYSYINSSLGGLFGSIAGITMWIGLIFASAFYMLGFGYYMASIFGGIPVSLAALSMAIFLVFLNVYGVHETERFQSLIVTLLVGLIMVFIVLGIFQIDAGRLSPFNPEGWSAVSATIGAIFVSFIGFEVIAVIAEEVENPKRNIPLAMIAAVIIPTVLYALVMLVCIGTLDIGVLADSTVPVADVSREFMGGIGALGIVVGAVLATVSSANSSILAASRINFAMGRDKVLTGWLNSVHDKFRTPYKSILLTGLIILFLISMGAGVDILARIAGFAYLLTYALVHISLIVVRSINPENYRPSFKTPAYPIVPILGLLGCIGILTQMSSMVLIIGFSIAVVGAFWYAIYCRGRVEKHGELTEYVKKEGLETKEARYRVLVPVAHPRSQRHLLEIAASSASTRESAELIALNVIEVPRQMHLTHSVRYEEERIENQRELLVNARDYVEELGLELETRAVIARSFRSVVGKIIREDEVNHLVLGWRGGLSPKEHILGSNIDSIIREAKNCRVSVVKMGATEIGEVVAFVGDGPNTQASIEQAHELSKSPNAKSLTLLNVQIEEEGGYAREELLERGREHVKKIAERMEIDEGSYETKIIVSGERGRALIEAANKYDTVCLGAARQVRLGKSLFGDLAEEIGRLSDSTVVMVRDSNPPLEGYLRALYRLLKTPFRR